MPSLDHITERLPATLEASNFRKTTDEFVFTIASPRKFYDEYIKVMLGHLGGVGVFSYRPCRTLDDAEAILQQQEPETPCPLPSAPAAPATEFATCAEMAAIFGITERRVQQLEKAGIFAKTGQDQYDLRKSVKGYMADKRLRSKSSDINLRRMENLEKKNRELDRLHLVEMGKLVNAEEVQRARETENAQIRQMFIYLKALAPQLEGRTIAEIEKRLDEYGRKCLVSLDRSGKDGEPEDMQPQKAQKAQRKKKDNLTTLPQLHRGA